MTPLDLRTAAAEVNPKRASGVVQSYCPGISREDAEDAIQDAWLALYERGDTLSEAGNIRGWLLTVAATKARSGRRRKRPVALDALEGANDWLGQRDTSAEQIEARELLAAVADLPSKQRAALEAVMRGEPTVPQAAVARRQLRANLGMAEPTRREWTRDTAREALQAFFERTGRVPSQKDARSESLPGSNTAARLFGSWSDAVRAAGMTPHKKGNHRWTTEAITEAIEKWAETHNGEPPTANELRTDRPEWMPPQHALIRHFGSFNAAIAAAGFEPRQSWFGERVSA